MGKQCRRHPYDFPYHQARGKRRMQDGAPPQRCLCRPSIHPPLSRFLMMVATKPPRRIDRT